MSRRNRIISIFCLILLGVLCYWGVAWFLDNHERLTREERTGMSPQARRNPLLAAERFLNLLGRQAQSISGREHLLTPPAEKGAYIVYHLGPNLPKVSEDAWIEWMQRGGRMIITPEVETKDDNAQPNHLLARFGVHLYQIEADTDSTGEKKEAQLHALRFPGHDQPVKIVLDSRLVLEDEGELADLALLGPKGPHLLYLPVGGGAMIVLSENTFLTNDQIGIHDHAWLLATLVESAEYVWILYRSDMPSLALLIWRHAPWLIIALLLLLTLGLWRFSFRTGPLLPPADRARRDLLEHLQASAAWAWRVEKGVTMLAANNRILEQGWLARHPGLHSMRPDARCEWIAGQCGMTQAAVKLALYGQVEDDQALIRLSTVQRTLLIELRKNRQSVEKKYE